MRRNYSQADKQRYRESKRRRKQALLADETGVLKPIGRKKSGKIILITVLAALLVAAVCGVIVYFNTAVQNAETLTPDEISAFEGGVLLVVNRQNPLDKAYVPKLAGFKGVNVSEEALPALEAFDKALKEQGGELVISSGYVSYDEQESLYNAKLDELMLDSSYSKVRAEAAAQRVVPAAGCSEAQTGLLLGFVLDDVRTKAFVERNCVNYGFVQRYPEGKDEQTHMESSETLYRYVGTENAVKMRSFDMCLEEYVNYTDIGVSK